MHVWIIKQATNYWDYDNLSTFMRQLRHAALFVNLFNLLAVVTLIHWWKCLLQCSLKVLILSTRRVIPNTQKSMLCFSREQGRKCPPSHGINAIFFPYHSSVPNKKYIYNDIDAKILHWFDLLEPILLCFVFVFVFLMEQWCTHKLFFF